MQAENTYPLFTDGPILKTINTTPEATLIATTGIDLILPCCNPPDNWVETLLQHYEEVLRVMTPAPIQLILVNDGSTRNFTAQHMTQLKLSIPDIIIVSYPVNRGKGHAVREGARQVSYDLHVYTDLDFPFGVAVIKQVYEQLLTGTDVVAGERGAAYLALLPAKRKLITLISRSMNRFLLRLKIADAQAGLKGFNQHGRNILLSTHIDGFMYDSEFIYKAGRHPQINIASLDITCRPGICFSSFRLKLLIKEFRNYLQILRIRFPFFAQLPHFISKISISFFLITHLHH